MEKSKLRDVLKGKRLHKLDNGEVVLVNKKNKQHKKKNKKKKKKIK